MESARWDGQEQKPDLPLARQKRCRGSRKAVCDRGVIDCRIKSWTAAGAEGLLRARVSGALSVMEAASVAVARLEAQTIGPGDNVGRERRLVLAPPQ